MKQRIKFFLSFIESSELHGRSLEPNSKNYFGPLSYTFLLKMASVSTALLQGIQWFSASQSSGVPSASFGTSDENFAENRTPLQRECDIKELKTVAINYKKLEEPMILLEDSGEEDDDDEAFNKVFGMIYEDIPLFQRPTVRLFALLGLKLDFLDRLQTISAHHIYHRSLCEWITIFLQNKSRAISLEKKTQLTLELLDSIGFDRSSTAVKNIMASSSMGNMQYHIEPCEWAEIFIQDEFNYNPMLYSGVCSFPFESDLTNSWFQLPPNTDVEVSENDPNPCRVNIMNFVTTKSNALKGLRSKLDGFLSQSDGATVLYHGTDHRSARNILSRGICLTAGRLKRDFSCGTGFYLTMNLDEAVNWALSTTKKPAILVFQVNRKHLDSAKRLDLNNDEGRWHEIVTSFRSGTGTANTRKSVSAYDLIEGPQAAMSYDEASRELVWKRKPSSYQMCLISDDLAETFKKSLHSIFFLET